MTKQQLQVIETLIVFLKHHKVYDSYLRGIVKNIIPTISAGHLLNYPIVWRNMTQGHHFWKNLSVKWCRMVKHFGLEDVGIHSLDLMKVLEFDSYQPDNPYYATFH